MGAIRFMSKGRIEGSHHAAVCITLPMLLTGLLGTFVRN